MDEKKFKELMENEEFVTKMLEAATIEEVKSLFSEKGITLTDEDLDQMAKGLEAIVNNNGVVPDANLTDVTGGKKITISDAAAMGAGAGAVGASALLTAGAYAAYKLYRKGVQKGQQECLEVIKNSGLLNNRLRRFV